MDFDPISAALSGIGVIGGLFGANQANRTARDQLKLQQQQAQREAGLFNTASPYYGQILAALAGNAGLNNPTPSNPNATPGAGLPGGNFTGAPQLPYTNVSNAQLGLFGSNPADAFRLRAAEDEARQGLLSGLHQFSFGAGQRGLFGSSTDAAGRAALINAANQNTAQFGRQLAIQAPQTAMERLTTMAGLLNPGLGAGPAAGNLFGQGAQAYAGMGQAYGQQAGGALANWAQYNALQNVMNRYQPAPQTVNVSTSYGTLPDYSAPIPGISTPAPPADYQPAGGNPDYGSRL